MALVGHDVFLGLLRMRCSCAASFGLDLGK
jgi:hypothetical protein